MSDKGHGKKQVSTSPQKSEVTEPVKNDSGTKTSPVTTEKHIPEHLFSA